MLPPAVLEAFQTLAAVVAAQPEVHIVDALAAHWRGVPEAAPEGTRGPADLLDRALPALTRSTVGTADLGRLLVEGAAGEVLWAWCNAAVGRSDVRLAPLLANAGTVLGFAERVPQTARDRVLEGPLLDALACAPLTGDGQWLAEEEHAQVRARLEILLWEAGAAALQLPELGTWLWGSEATFRALVTQPARASLRGRVLAARCLEVAARGLSADASPEMVGRTLQALQPLLLHPEPLVWIHAARAVGRLAGALEMLEGTLLDWMRGESALLRQRAMTAFASQPADRLKMFAGELASVLEEPGQEPWVLAAAAAATPYLMFERRELWDKLAARVTAGEGGAVAARGLARGLGALWRRGMHTSAVETPMRALRDLARRARSETVGEWRRWLEVLSETDAIDGAERDPLDVERGLENLVRLAAQYDDEEADARALRFANSLATTFQEARRVTLSESKPRRRAAGLNALEGVARSLALSLWGPMLQTRPADEPTPEPDLEETWGTVVHAPPQLLEELYALRAGGALDAEAVSALEVLVVRLGGYALDACGEEPTLGPGRGPTAHQVCLWLRKLEGLADGSRELGPELEGALSSLFWRLVDSTRGTALGETDDVRWLGPFAAWWSLVIDRPVVLQKLARALPMLTPGVLEHCTGQAEALRAALIPDAAGSHEGRWLDTVKAALSALKADETELGLALLGFGRALAGFTTTSGGRGDLTEKCLALTLASERLTTALEDPVKALTDIEIDVEFESEGAPRVAAQLAGAIKARDVSVLEIWLSSLGTLAGPLVERALAGAVRRTPPPPPSAKKEGPERIEGYELVRPLGEGGIGAVMLVRKPGADRLFVLKIPRADALLGASDTEREAILESFLEEARALGSLYHPNICNIIDRGIHKGVPYLVLEYLIGTDLRGYCSARRMTLGELRNVVSEACAGLASLHSAGLVHRDVKPANIWLRLPLKGGETFDPQKHREPTVVPVLATVVIDFGMVRAFRIAQEAMGRFVAGTPGYLAPEQVMDPIDLDGRADVYAMAGTVYNAMTGRTFFDDVTNPRERIVAHMHREPLEDPERVRGFPAALVKLLRVATNKSPNDRPNILEFGREFLNLG